MTLRSLHACSPPRKPRTAGAPSIDASLWTRLRRRARARQHRCAFASSALRAFLLYRLSAAFLRATPAHTAHNARRCCNAPMLPFTAFATRALLCLLSAFSFLTCPICWPERAIIDVCSRHPPLAQRTVHRRSRHITIACLALPPSHTAYSVYRRISRAIPSRRGALHSSHTVLHRMTLFSTRHRFSLISPSLSPFCRLILSPGISLPRDLTRVTIMTTTTLARRAPASTDVDVLTTPSNDMMNLPARYGRGG